MAGLCAARSFVAAGTSSGRPAGRRPGTPTARGSLSGSRSGGRGTCAQSYDEDLIAPHVQMGNTPVLEVGRQARVREQLREFEAVGDSIVFAAYVISGLALVLAAAQGVAHMVSPELDVGHAVKPLPFAVAWVLLRRRYKTD